MSALIVLKCTTRGFSRSLLVNSDSTFANHLQARATISCAGLPSLLRPQHRHFRSVFCSRRHVSTYQLKVTPGKLPNHTLSPQVKEQVQKKAEDQAEEQENMQVTRGNFGFQLPKVVERLRKSMFVTFDLEFSGIGKARDGSRQSSSSRSRGKQSLQECYTNLKETVETYQVLQVGLCPVEWSEEQSEC